MAGIKLSKEQLSELFLSLDTDESGQIEYNELHKKLRKKCVPTQRERKPSLTPSMAANLESERSEAQKTVEEAQRRLVRLQNQLSRTNALEVITEY